ncbi:DUF1684 domain-containing protein [Fulvivirga ligni]|uniref:DUF1684 domain-containing protein n=1 Tax=Fulvivirga ligni TaxID=2904246 RepID=UPI001F26CC81|nr:DUF1684 domain-containing protein [Fulvivirga ligni]UII23605.1 DUF1684 domain-containing protein [Fulvivirga ligni]
MQKIVFSLILILGATHLSMSQTSEVVKDVKEFQKEINHEFASKKESPLSKEDRKKFKGLDFFPIDTNYHITAKFIRTPNQKPFKMATSGDRSPIYEKYGEAHFTLDSIEVVLEIYQSHDLRKTEEYKDYLFLPFTDKTNGEETYGGGRYIGLRIPENDQIVIDFNKAYNPYCAYSDKYSCPLVPRQNRILAYMRAGVKAYELTHH